MKEKNELSREELIEAIDEASRQAAPDEAKSALLYCLKQLKISAATDRRN